MENEKEDKLIKQLFKEVNKIILFQILSYYKKLMNKDEDDLPI